jgi:predicted RNase H-like HicB family nuclease
MAAKYQVELERDDRGWWIARVPSVPGAHTQGRSIAQALNRIREALALWVDDAERAEVIAVFRLPAPTWATVKRALTTRERADRVQQEAAIVLRQTIGDLIKREDLSTRDVAMLLELSPARVDQLKPAVGVQARSAAGSLSSKKAVARRKTVAKKATSKKKKASSKKGTSRKALA